ncbi:tetratricopeptide repeat protein [Taibaiella chishuiensis]|uniref:YaiO family outer membrane protein n=1 Tax=Taibaiella chishuiensis TaxID=1434707 RepID=A0A2P8D7I2_9BACT|nr:tetratricopeptide repeat protein [Taibaiella chishuiensis]PSK93184.1 YaiO family outer membrane protein [Taibaiella chishuiensis]
MKQKYFFPFIALLLLLFAGFPVAAQKNKEQANSDLLVRQIKAELEGRKDYAKALELARKGAKEFPRNADFQYLLGRIHLLNKDLQKAQSRADEIIDKAPEYRDAYLLGADIQLARSNENGALFYINKGLNRFGRDKELRLKKMVIYQAAGNYTMAGMQADSLLYNFGNDRNVVATYINYRNETGAYYMKAGNMSKAAAEFQKVLEIDPKNKTAFDGNMNTKLQSGDLESSLAIVNTALVRDPNAYDLLWKKIGLLQELKRYPEALDALQFVRKKFPADHKSAQLETELRLEAARYYKSTDPYSQYVAVLEKSPGNREALENVINIAISRGMYDEALAWINKALGKTGSDRELLKKKMSLLEQQQKYIAAAAIADRLYGQQSSDKGLRESFIDLYSAASREYAQQQMPDSALYAYGRILRIEPANELALNGSVNILSGQKRYGAALDMVDKALGYFPGDERLLLKKAGILQEDGQDEAATAILETLQARRPGEKVSRNLVEAQLVTGRKMMQAMDYDGAAAQFRKVLELEPQHKETLNTIINIDLARGRAGAADALQHTADAIAAYPQDRELLMKRSAALFNSGRYEEANTITGDLMQQYPYNTRIRDAYRDQMTTYAGVQRKNGDTTGALLSYGKVLQVKPEDTIALQSMNNLYFNSGNYEAVLSTSDTGLYYHPDNASFMIKKASALEQLQRYQEAARQMDTVVTLYPDRAPYKDYQSYLKSKNFKNQIGIAYLNSHIDSTQSANIATLQYTHYFKHFSLAGRLNFAGRAQGTGLQGELEAYVYHGKKWYSYASAGIANKVVFPKLKASYSLFHNFATSWEAELGGRFQAFDSLNAISGVASLSRYLGDFWLNLRGYAIFYNGKQYGAGVLTARQYLNNKTDFFYANVGYGNSPDDFSRLYQLGETVKYTTYSIGAGYQKMFNYRNIVSLNGTWYNQKIGASRYRNQYDIYLVFLRKF